MEKHRILGIAPFKNLLLTMNHVAKKFKDIYFESYVGDLEEGVAIAKEKEKDFDIIISRGGTAKLLKKEINIPTIEIEVSVTDILRAIKLAENFKKKFAIIGFSNITKPAHTIAEILQMELDIITINNQDEVRSVIRKLKNNNFDVIIGDKITSKIATENELNAILILSGEESVFDAFKNAIFLAKYSHDLKKKIDFHLKIYDEFNFFTYVLNKKYEIIFQSGNQNKHNLLKQIINDLKSKQFQRNERNIFYKKYYGKLYEIESINKESYICIFIKPICINENSRGIQLINDREMGKFYSELINSSYFVGNTKKRVSTLSNSNKPILLIGEIGTGKETTALIFHKKYKNKYFWRIDFSKLKQEEYDSLFFSDRSIFLDSYSTFYLCNIDLLSNYNLEIVLNFIENAKALSNNWILSYTKKHNNSIDENSPLKTFDHHIIYLPSLRERKNDIGAIISKYINALNIKHDKQIIGLEPNALQLMIEFPWPQNLIQLKRVVEELFLLTTTYYISEKTVRLVLDNEKVLNDTENIEDITDKFENLSLKQIQYEIIKDVLRKNYGNQTKTAKQLGISRSTLWRILKNNTQ